MGFWSGLARSGMDIQGVEKSIGYVFRDKSLMVRALTLPSYSEDNYQSLEFFGDAILEFIVSEKIYNEAQREGVLTERRKALVADSALAPVSRRLGLDRNLMKSAGDNTNKKATPSVYESMVAAIYLDGGMDEARKFVLRTLDFEAPLPGVNYKGDLQELLQAKGLPCPVYEKSSIGTPQEPWFKAAVEVFGKQFSAEAGSVRGAEQLAAKAALDDLAAAAGRTEKPENPEDMEKGTV
ncbi:MAG: putative dsRNA-binding protein [Clostridia bacterium]|nr:putative dsRNA-binding protein [Clostridia bacterium]